MWGITGMDVTKRVGASSPMRQEARQRSFFRRGGGGGGSGGGGGGGIGGFFSGLFKRHYCCSPVVAIVLIWLIGFGIWNSGLFRSRNPSPSAPTIGEDDDFYASGQPGDDAWTAKSAKTSQPTITGTNPSLSDASDDDDDPWSSKNTNPGGSVTSPSLGNAGSESDYGDGLGGSEGSEAAGGVAVGKDSNINADTPKPAAKAGWFSWLWGGKKKEENTSAAPEEEGEDSLTGTGGPGVGRTGGFGGLPSTGMGDDEDEESGGGGVGGGRGSAKGGAFGARDEGAADEAPSVEDAQVEEEEEAPGEDDEGLLDFASLRIPGTGVRGTKVMDLERQLACVAREGRWALNSTPRWLPWDLNPLTVKEQPNYRTCDMLHAQREGGIYGLQAERIRQKYSRASRRRGSVVPDWKVRREVLYEWRSSEPERCPFVRFDRKGFCRAVRGRNVVLVGDAFSLDMHDAVLNHLVTAGTKRDAGRLGDGWANATEGACFEAGHQLCTDVPITPTFALPSSTASGSYGKGPPDTTGAAAAAAAAAAGGGRGGGDGMEGDEEGGRASSIASVRGKERRRRGRRQGGGTRGRVLLWESDGSEEEDEEEGAEGTEGGRGGGGGGVGGVGGRGVPQGGSIRGGEGDEEDEEEGGSGGGGSNGWSSGEAVRELYPDMLVFWRNSPAFFTCILPVPPFPPCKSEDLMLQEVRDTLEAVRELYPDMLVIWRNSPAFFTCILPVPPFPPCKSEDLMLQEVRDTLEAVRELYPDMLVIWRNSPAFFTCILPVPPFPPCKSEDLMLQEVRDTLEAVRELYPDMLVIWRNSPADHPTYSPFPPCIPPPFLIPFPEDLMLQEVRDTLEAVRELYPDMLVIWRNSPAGHPSCHRFTRPLKRRPKPLQLKGQLPATWTRHAEMNAAVRSLLKEYGVVYLDVDSATSLRPDGHHRRLDGTVDCRHYCMPSPLDHWVSASRCSTTCSASLIPTPSSLSTPVSCWQTLTWLLSHSLPSLPPSLPGVRSGLPRDVDSATSLRPDGHHRRLDGTVDCRHYCMPGPLDHWVSLLYNLLRLIDTHSQQPQQPVSPSLLPVHPQLTALPFSPFPIPLCNSQEYGVVYLDVDSATSLRPDGHHRRLDGTVDCRHYCMPGPLDHWVEEGGVGEGGRDGNREGEEEKGGKGESRGEEGGDGSAGIRDAAGERGAEEGIARAVEGRKEDVAGSGEGREAGIGEAGKDAGEEAKESDGAVARPLGADGQEGGDEGGREEAGTKEVPEQGAAEEGAAEQGAGGQSAGEQGAVAEGAGAGAGGEGGGAAGVSDEGKEGGEAGGVKETEGSEEEAGEAGQGDKKTEESHLPLSPSPFMYTLLSTVFLTAPCRNYSECIPGMALRGAQAVEQSNREMACLKSLLSFLVFSLKSPNSPSQRPAGTTRTPCWNYTECIPGTAVRGAQAVEQTNREMACLAKEGRWIKFNTPRWQPWSKDPNRNPLAPHYGTCDILHRRNKGVFGKAAEDIRVSGTGDWNVRPELKHTWKASRFCPPLNGYNRDKFCRAVGHRNVVFVGDQSQLALHDVFINHVLTMKTAKDIGTAADAWEENEIPLCHRKPHIVCSDHVPGGFTFRVVHNNLLSPDSAGGGKFNQRWLRHLSEWNTSIIVLNKGFEKRPTPKYLSTLRASLAKLREVAPDVLLVWRNTWRGHPDCGNATEPLKAVPHNETMDSPWSYVVEQNEGAKAIVKEFGGLYIDLDWSLSMRPDGHIKKLDGQSVYSTRFESDVAYRGCDVYVSIAWSGSLQQPPPPLPRSVHCWRQALGEMGNMHGGMAALIVLQVQAQLCLPGAPSSRAISAARSAAQSRESVRSRRVSLAPCPSARSRIGASGRMGAGSSALHSDERWRKLLSATAKPKWGHTFKRTTPRWTAAVVPSTKPSKRQSEPQHTSHSHHNAHSTNTTTSSSTSSSSSSSSSSKGRAIATVPRAPSAPIPREPATRRLFANFSRSGRKRPLWKQAGMWIAGAAAAAVGVQVSAQVLEALDKVPFLADLEVLVGTGVALNFLSSYVRGGPARARVQSGIDSIVDSIRGFDSPADSDLQLQLQQLVADTTAEAARSQALQARAADLNQSLQASKRAAQAAAQKLEELRAANGRLQAERSESRAAMGGLQQQVASLSAALGNLTADTDALKQSKEKLASKVQAALTDNQSLQASLASAKSRQQQQVAAAEAMRAQLRAAEVTLGEREEALRRAQAESAQEKMTYTARLEGVKKERDEALAAVVVVEARLAALEATLQQAAQKERDEAQAAVVVVEARLAALEAKLQQAAQTRTEIFKNNAELKARLESVLQQNRDLATQAARMEESGRQGELRRAEEEKQKYMEACDWLEKQLATLKAENETTIADLRSSLAFAEQRAKEEGAKVVQLRAELDKQTKDADRHKAALRKKVAELEGKLGSSQSQLSIAEKALATAMAAANRTRGVNALVLDLVSKGAEEQWARKHVTEALLKPALAAADAAAAAKTSTAAGVGKAGKKAVSKEALQSYARAIQHAYIDDSIPVKEQQAGMQLLVQELVAMGGEEEWARNFVHDSMVASPASPHK
ncbi:unnamed protein product [Closterium sp. Yama58-4]|nr:unnamed protein product [Closterium sp. Yama58-4]